MCYNLYVGKQALSYQAKNVLFAQSVSNSHRILHTEFQSCWLGRQGNNVNPAHPIEFYGDWNAHQWRHNGSANGAPKGNAENAISDTLNSKIFLRRIPPDPRTPIHVITLWGPKFFSRTGAHSHVVPATVAHWVWKPT